MAAVARAALCLCLCLFASEVRGSFVSQDMNRTIQNLRQHYRLSKEDFNRNPVFSKELLTGRDEMKMVVMGGILDTYDKLLDHMLKQLPAAATPTPPLPASVSPGTAGAGAGDGDRAGDGDGDVRVQLQTVLNKIRELKKTQYGETEELLTRLKKLRDIQMDDRVVQSKALLELRQLYENASRLSRSRAQRRRRHARPRAALSG